METQSAEKRPSSSGPVRQPTHRKPPLAKTPGSLYEELLRCDYDCIVWPHNVTGVRGPPLQRTLFQPAAATGTLRYFSKKAKTWFHASLACCGR